MLVFWGSYVGVWGSYVGLGGSSVPVPKVEWERGFSTFRGVHMQHTQMINHINSRGVDRPAAVCQLLTRSTNS